MCVRVCVSTESLCCIPETIKTLQINYTSIQNIFPISPFFSPLHSMYLCVLLNRKKNAYFEKLEIISLPSDCPLRVFPLVFTI